MKGPDYLLVLAGVIEIVGHESTARQYHMGYQLVS